MWAGVGGGEGGAELVGGGVRGRVQWKGGKHRLPWFVSTIDYTSPEKTAKT